MATNTYLPHIGGVARSVSSFAESYRKLGHEVLILAPEFDGKSPDEEHVLRLPAIQNFNGSDFSVQLPIPSMLFPRLEEFRADIVHAHHPFLIGDTALRIAAKWNVPLVFTHHTMYERYTHYVPGDSKALKQFAIRLGTGYANLCHRVIAPSESIRDVLRQRGVDSPIVVVPTGVDTTEYSHGDPAGFRTRLGIPQDAIVFGHVGRLAPEKNLSFLSEAIATVLQQTQNAHFVVVGTGPSEATICKMCREKGVFDRVHLTGALSGTDLVDAYHGMDIFVFASTTETQGMVLAEAMAAGVPVIALDAPGAREVVSDRKNGRLIRRERRQDFVRACQWFLALSATEKKQLREEALRTAQSFSREACTERCLEVYKDCLSEVHAHVEFEGSVWETTLRLFESEWDLFKNRAGATGIASFLWRHHPLIRLEQAKRWIRRQLSRAEWSVRLLQLDKTDDTSTQRGLVLIQIDGFSRTHFERALSNGKLPFLRRLISREGYDLTTFYSGLPSTTPAVQGELFYGKKCAVPAFSFYSSKLKRIVRMLTPDAINAVEEELRQESDGLLTGGSSYTNIYGGGASEIHLSPAAFSQTSKKQLSRAGSLFTVLIWHTITIVRVVFFTCIELFLACTDAITGALHNGLLWQELKFIPARVGVCSLFAELSTTGAILDVTRGLPIIHVNYLGYDEQSHRRGPDSSFAYWSLKGIDHSIKRIWNEAKRSSRRDYQVWIYSDHGQETVESYSVKYGRTVQEAIRQVLASQVSSDKAQLRRYQESVELQRIEWLRRGWNEKHLQSPHRYENSEHDNTGMDGSVFITAMGPLGHVYLSLQVSHEEKWALAERLVDEANIPIVFFREGGEEIFAVTEDGRMHFPQDGRLILDHELPYFEELLKDLSLLISHPDAGTFVISGWRKNGQPMSFPIESGAHGGPGSEETRGFALLPKLYRHELRGGAYLRPLDLRALALRFLDRTKEVPRDPAPAIIVGRNSPTLRVMSYNVHSCRGMDGRISCERIAEVIARFEPDVVCLQELDVGRKRSDGRNQAKDIAERLGMHSLFHPAIQVEGEEYGDAILSRYALRLVKAEKLPDLPGRPELEPRGALWAEIEVEGLTFQLLNTHFGLREEERTLQAHELMSRHWLGHESCQERIIFCGDLNASPGSYVHQMFSLRLNDAHRANGRPAKATWSSSFPVRRIDYIFLSVDLRVQHVDAPRGALTRIASDHLPVIADILVPVSIGSHER